MAWFGRKIISGGGSKAGQVSSAPDGLKSKTKFVWLLAENGTGGDEPPSEVGNQVAHANTEGFGNPHQGVHGNIFHPAFDGADINRMQVGFFSEFFLAQLGLLPANPNGFAKNPAVF
jgi:hypothetical protein